MKKFVKHGLLILLVVLMLAGLLSGCSEEPATEKEIDPGEIYFQETPEENIVQNEQGIYYANNEILVTSKEGIEKSKIEELAKKYDAEIVGYIEITNDYQWKFNKTHTYEELEKIISEVEKEEGIESVIVQEMSESDGEVYSVPNDSRWENQWSATNPEGNNWGAEAIYAPYAWAYKDYMTPVRVGLLDNMFNTEHEDVSFAETVYNPESDKISNDHGTHVAGTMAADFNNEKGISGIYPFGKDKDGNNNIYGVALSGTHKMQSVFDIKVAFAELITKNVKVINVSYGYTVDSFLAAKDEPGYRESLKAKSKSLGDFLEKLIDEGFDFVITKSAGNQRGYFFKKLDNGEWVRLTNNEEGAIPGSDYENIADWGWYVSSIDNEKVKNRIIVVGASGCEDTDSGNKYALAYFSDMGERVDVIAPGVNIESASYGTDQYVTKPGTSMAAPHVAGVAASVWSFNPDLTGEDVKNIIKETSKTQDSQVVEGTDVRMVDMYSALVKAGETRKDGNPFADKKSIVTSYVYGGGTAQKDVSVSAYKEGSDEVITTVKTDGNGLFELELDPGTYRIEVSCDNFEKKVIDKVELSKGQILCLDNIYLSGFVTDFTVPEEMEIIIGELDVIEPETNPSDADGYQIKWTSSDESVVEVTGAGNAGIINARAKGSAVVTVEITSGGKTMTKSTKVTVTSVARDTILVLDVSGSMNGTPMREMKESAIKFCEDLLGGNTKNRVGLVFYDTYVKSYDMTSDLDYLTDRIESVSTGGVTNMEGGLSTAKRMMDKYGRDNAVKNIIVMADGLPNDGKTSYSGSMPSSNYYGYNSDLYANAVIDTAKEIMQSYNLYSLAFFHGMEYDSLQYGRTLMQQLTNKGDDGYYEVEDAENLQFAFGDITEEVDNGSKIVIHIACPVDVNISYNGEMLSSAEGSFNDATSFGTVKLLGKNKDIKVVTLDSDKNYDVELLGTGNGEMDYAINYYDENEVLSDFRIFEAVPLTPETVITTDTDNQAKEEITLNVDEDGDGEVDVIWTAAARSLGSVTFDKNPEPTEEPEVVENESSAVLLVACISVICVLVAIGVCVIVATSRKKEDTPSGDIIIRVDDEQVRCPNCGQLHKKGEMCSCLKNSTTEDRGIAPGVIQVTAGSMKGHTMTVNPGQTIYIGKDKKLVSLVLTPDYTHVSRVHCSLTYDEARRTYFVVDCSSNGTFIQHRQRLVKGKRTPVKADNVLVLANDNCTILLG